VVRQTKVYLKDDILCNLNSTMTYILDLNRFEGTVFIRVS
jgi:hypothetical protein